MGRRSIWILLAISCAGREPAARLSNTTVPPLPMTTAIVLAINLQEVWLGNDELEQDPGATFHGALNGIKLAIDKLDGRVPRSAQAAIVGYETGARIVHPMAPIENLTGGVLGVQRDYRGTIGTDMIQGIVLGLGLLDSVDAPRKVLVVIGDGNDTYNEVAKRKLQELRRRALKAGIELFAIMYKGEVSDVGNVIATFVPAVKTVSNVDGIAAELAAIVAP